MTDILTSQWFLERALTESPMAIREAHCPHQQAIAFMARKRRKRNASPSATDQPVPTQPSTPHGKATPAAIAGRDDRKAQKPRHDPSSTDNASPQKKCTATEPSVAKPVAKKPIAEKSVAKPPVAEKPIAQTAAAEKPAAEKPVSQIPFAEESFAEESIAEEPVAEESVAEKATAETPVTEGSVSETSGAGEVSDEGAVPGRRNTATKTLAKTETKTKTASRRDNVGDQRLVAMLEIVNQLLAEQSAPGGLAGAATVAIPPQISEQLRHRAAELDRRDAALQAQFQALHAHEETWILRDESLREREQVWVRQSAELAASRRELARRLRQHRNNERAEQALAEQTAQLTERVEGVAAAFRHESSQVRDVLLETLTAFQEHVSQSQTVDPGWLQQLEAKEEEIASLHDQLQRSRETLEQATAELETLRESHEQHDENSFGPSDADLQSLAAQVESLQKELEAANRHAEELQSQNGDLAGRVVSSSVNNRLTNDGAQSLESLPWEERKRLILARLEDEESNYGVGQPGAADPKAGDVRDELQSLRDLVHQTDREIMRRDAEIAELRQLLDQQSNTFGEVAIGAAAIAGMFDQDDLIREERTKLQEIKSEWQEKLREAEVEVSLERAKLARERQELEKRNAALEEMLAHQERAQHHPTTDNEGKPARRWLARMGLSEE